MNPSSGAPTLAAWLLAQPQASAALRAAVAAIAEAGAALSAQIARGFLDSPLGAEVGRNTDGDHQKALDVLADDAFRAALGATPTRWLASEEQAEPLALNADGSLAIAIDPLDGSSNIDVNAPIGTIFSVFEAKDDAFASFLRPAREQIGAGYLIYGPQTMLALTLGAGVGLFILDPQARAFIAARTPPSIAPASNEYAINASNRRFWANAVRAYIEDRERGADGPDGRDANMRWVASLVADAHRVLMRGGVYLYPGDARRGYENGRLRMLYECAPIAFLVEQAGGRATDGARRLLDLAPDTLHARAPLVFGSAVEVDRVSAYGAAPEADGSPLFARRGLLTT